LNLVFSDAVLWWFPITLITGIVVSMFVNHKNNRETDSDSTIIFNIEDNKI
jgi:quinol-cytochrome oxidoreductase complex cytochrome b subunit